MLISLKIHNIALISQCELEFSKGLNVLSGETGAGKSIILDSINFALGQKADKTMISHGATECSATCVFDISESSKARTALAECGLECDDIVIIKRTFNESGKGSIKLNGESVTVSMLRRVTSHLVDVHGQSEHFSLLKEGEQLELIDRINEAEILAVKQTIGRIIADITALKNQLDAFGGNEQERANRLDLLDYSIQEIEKSVFYEGEEAELLAKRKKLQNLEKIIQATSAAYEALSGETGACDAVGVACRHISSLINFDEEYELIHGELENCLSAMQDLTLRLAQGLEEEFDQHLADEIERRIEVIQKLKAKYGRTYNDIMLFLEKAKKEYDLISQSSEQTEMLKEEINRKFSKLYMQYKNLTQLRRKAADKLSIDLVERLKELAMKNVRFFVQFSELESNGRLSLNGIDRIEFMFSANAGEPLNPLSKIISGGELSRLMLAVKSVTASVYDSNTYIFDEIDTGLSGAAATVVAENFARISKSKQIIAISHLPQIVSMSDLSMLIQKSQVGNRTITSISALSDDEKILEVVRLIGGDTASQSAIAHSKEMIKRASGFKKNIQP